MAVRSQVFVALDYANADSAWQLVNQLDPQLCGLKVGRNYSRRQDRSLFVNWYNWVLKSF